MNRSSDFFTVNHVHVPQDDPTCLSMDHTSQHDNSFLLPLNGHIYDVSNLAPSSPIEPPPPVPKAPPKRRRNSFSLYPTKDSSMMESVKGLDELIRNWNMNSNNNNNMVPRSRSTRNERTAFPPTSSSTQLERRSTLPGRFDDQLWQPQHPPHPRHSTGSSSRYHHDHHHHRRSQHPLQPQHHHQQQQDNEDTHLSMSLDATTGCPLMELGGPGGPKVPYFGAAMTSRAIRGGNGLRTLCLGCNVPLLCMAGVDYVICPGCQTVSPITILPEDEEQPAASGGRDGRRLKPPPPPPSSSSSSPTSSSQEPNKMGGVGIGLRRPPMSSPTTAVAPAS